jgi:hypothetical protein
MEGSKPVFQIKEKKPLAFFNELKAKVAARSDVSVHIFSWADAKLKIDMTSSGDAQQEEEFMLQAAMLGATELDLDEKNETDLTQPEEILLVAKIAPCVGDICSDDDAGHQMTGQPPLDVIEFSPLAMKWIERADEKGREMLLMRIKRLAEGRRSYALSKRLKSTQNPIYEAKLGGLRILWTKLKRGDTLSILVGISYISCFETAHALQ